MRRDEGQTKVTRNPRIEFLDDALLSSYKNSFLLNDAELQVPQCGKKERQLY
jgi:hypothetical protein